ncbi:helix-turn-helix transcriptional regulator [Jiangella gansuensis]|uniref:helix-turn-helix transcriptional regulator n=1 Tax=Jiangella gansuensis TaxID=281473 RepID=UPI0004BBE73A|nr:LuxR C-terminal-related transcriptional regulator [Jiangella gansuensis]
MDLPRLPPDHVPRGRLLARLDRLAALTVVAALPGSGKTALVADWARRRREDGDVVAWIDASGPDGTGDELRARVDAAVEAGAGRTTIVVVDNADAADDALCSVVSASPWLHVVVCSRGWHPLVASAWRRGISVDTLTGPDLMMTADELDVIAAGWGHGGRDRLAGVHALTAGWMLPTRMVLDAASVAAGQETASSYLRTSVLAAVSDAVTRTAAMRLALAPSVTPVHLAAVTAAITNDHDDRPPTVDDTLGRLLRAGLLMPGRGRETWEIVPVLRSALAAGYASEAAAEAAEWHRRFAHALWDAGTDLGTAARHARAAEDWVSLVRLWDAAGLGLTVEHADDVVAAYGRLHARVLAEHPALRVPAEVARALLEQPRGVRTPDVIARAVLRAGEPVLRAEGVGRPSHLRVLVRSAGVVADRLDGRYERAIAGAASLDRELTERDRELAPGPWTIDRAWVSHQRARSLLLAGDIAAALDVATSAFATGRDGDRPALTAGIAADIALMHAVGGDTADAAHWLEVHAGYDESGRWASDVARHSIHIAGALLALDRLDRETAELHLAGADEEPEPAELWPFLVLAITQHALLFGDPAAALAVIERHERLDARAAAAGGAATQVLHRCRADAYLALGEVNPAGRVLQDAGRDVPWLRAARARFHLISGDDARAVRVAAAGVRQTTTTTRDRIDLLAVEAAAHEALGDTAAADRAFARVSVLATRLGAVRPYTLIDTDTRELLLKRSGLTLSPNALARVDRARRVFPARADLVLLTDRELAVLYELTRHRSWSGIAAALVVAPSTVKKQILAIYTKLGVHDREAALLRATALGFLPEPEAEPEPPPRGLVT